MKKLFASLVLLAACGLPLKATQYQFADFSVQLTDAFGASWSTPLTLEIGAFSGAFTPSAGNTGSWTANWLTGSIGYYDPSGPEWAAGLVLDDNATFAVGKQLYLWAFDSLVAPDKQWLLLTDPSWSVVLNSPDAIDPVLFAFTEDTSATFGRFDYENGIAASAVAQSFAPVPEPSTWAGAAVGSALALFVGYRRRKARLAKA